MKKLRLGEVKKPQVFVTPKLPDLTLLLPSVTLNVHT